MTDARPAWKRMVVGLPQGLADPAAVEAAATLAELLQIELLATFVADATLQTLGELSGVRELRLLEAGWQAIDAGQIERDLLQAAEIARRRFAEAVGTRAVQARFDVIADTETMTSLLRADDVVAIIEPAHPAERITRQFVGLLEAAFALAGAVLVVPRRIARTAGPIVALATSEQDPAIAVAIEIAAALKERLIIVTASKELPPELLAAAERRGVAVRHIVPDHSGADIWSLLPALRPQERLRVVSTDALPGGAALFSSLQGTPLLAVRASPV